MKYSASLSLHREFDTVGEAAHAIATLIDQFRVDGFALNNVYITEQLDPFSPAVAHALPAQSLPEPAPANELLPPDPTPAEKPKRARKGEAAVHVDPTPATSAAETATPGTESVTSSQPDQPASTAASATEASAPVDASLNTVDVDELRDLMKVLTTNGKRPQVKAAMDKHGGGAMSISSMTTPNQVAFFRALQEIA